MLEEIKALLAAFGYTATTEDDWMLSYILNKVTNNITTKCNLTVIPDSLREVAIDQVAGEFLLAKKSIGGLGTFNLEAAVKTIQEGDTSVTFGTDKSPSQMLDEIIAHLLHSDQNYGAYRRLKW